MIVGIDGDCCPIVRDSCAIDLAGEDMHAGSQALTFLVVEDCAPTVRLFCRTLATYGRVTVVKSVGEADELLKRDGGPNGLVVDATDPSVLNFLQRARKAYASMSILILSQTMASRHITRAYDLHAYYLTKPINHEQLHAFARSLNPAIRLKSSVDGWRVRYGLRDAEVDVFTGAVRGESREESAIRRASSPLTIKVHVANLLRKTGDTSFHCAIERLLREMAGIPERPSVAPKFCVPDSPR